MKPPFIFFHLIYFLITPGRIHVFPGLHYICDSRVSNLIGWKYKRDKFSWFFCVQKSFFKLMFLMDHPAGCGSGVVVLAQLLNFQWLLPKSSLQNCAIKALSVGWEKKYSCHMAYIAHIFLGIQLFFVFQARQLKFLTTVWLTI